MHEKALNELPFISISQDKGLENARFWGKIYGVEQNYIVVESDYVEGDEEEEEEEAEEEAENVGGLEA